MPCVSTKKDRWYWIRVARRLCNRCGRKSNPQPRRLLQRRRNPARRDGQGVWVGLVKRCWDRLPQCPHCTNNLTQGLERFQKGTATEKRYIQAQPAAMRLYLIFDVDRPNGGNAWHHADLPEPNWTSSNLENGHAHISWTLTSPVFGESRGASFPLRSLCTLQGKEAVVPTLIQQKQPSESCWRQSHMCLNPNRTDFFKIPRISYFAHSQNLAGRAANA